ncbi:hypothetical protein CDL15_Pgr004566 [Punica granatum]|uniref:XRCC4 N-terminal domain-containing protein n=1 Tax=Punica granatum TaxID=22663 RepID=A0A218WQM4_PUNGR|nr:hypothetical protein CDL15_Pgr004566 [Punica granatum]
MESPRHSCLKLELPNPTKPDKIEPIFIKATWYDTHFGLSIMNGLDSWVCKASEEEVRERAVHRRQKQAEKMINQMLGCMDALLSWTFEKEGTKLEWRWKRQPSPNPKKTNSGILNFLMDANIRLSFLSILNSKKEKLRELREQLFKAGGNGGKSPEVDEESMEKTDPFEEGSDSEVETVKSGTRTSEDVQMERQSSLQLVKDGEEGDHFHPFTRQFSETEGIAVNMFLELESHAVSSIARDRNSGKYTVGPILDLKGDARVGSCGAQLHEDLIAWLDNQPMSSVMFPHGQLQGGPDREPGLCSKASANLYEYEISCSHWFLWSSGQPQPKGKMEYPSDYMNLKHALPEGFLDQTAPIRKVIGGPTGNRTKGEAGREGKKESLSLFQSTLSLK